jgi:hypothetical protein
LRTHIITRLPEIGKLKIEQLKIEPRGFLVVKLFLSLINKPNGGLKKVLNWSSAMGFEDEGLRRV